MRKAGEHEPQVTVSTAFLNSPKLSFVLLYIERNTEHLFYFLQKPHRRKKGKQLVNFDYQNLNSLCSRAIIISTVCASSVLLSSYRNTTLNQE